MRRTKEWWARLDKYERGYLVYLERVQHKYYSGGGYLPDDCSECSGCSQPMLGGGGLCATCGGRLDALIAKANGEVDDGQGN